jgi:hypothetical protein
MVFQDADSQIVGETVAEDVAFGRKPGVVPLEVAARVASTLQTLGLQHLPINPVINCPVVKNGIGWCWGGYSPAWWCWTNRLPT